MSDLVGFIDEHRDEFGVELMCRSLQMAPSTYYAAKKRELAPSARAVRDAVLMQVLMVLWVTNRKVYGAHKLWKAAVRAGHDIGRDQTARLMRELGIEGISRSEVTGEVPGLQSVATAIGTPWVRSAATGGARVSRSA